MYGTYPSTKFKLLTKSDTNPVTYTSGAVTGDPKSPLYLTRCRALYVGGAGDVCVQDDAGNSIVFSNVAAGTLLPISTRFLMSTGTSATLVVALF